MIYKLALPGSNSTAEKNLNYFRLQTSRHRSTAVERSKEEINITFKPLWVLFGCSAKECYRTVQKNKRKVSTWQACLTSLKLHHPKENLNSFLLQTCRYRITCSKRSNVFLSVSYWLFTYFVRSLCAVLTTLPSRQLNELETLRRLVNATCHVTLLVNFDDRREKTGEEDY